MILLCVRDQRVEGIFDPLLSIQWSYWPKKGSYAAMLLRRREEIIFPLPKRSKPLNLWCCWRINEGSYPSIRIYLRFRALKHTILIWTIIWPNSHEGWKDRFLGSFPLPIVVCIYGDHSSSRSFSYGRRGAKVLLTYFWRIKRLFGSKIPEFPILLENRVGVKSGIIRHKNS